MTLKVLTPLLCNTEFICRVMPNLIYRDRQRHLNPILQEVVKKEHIKWLDNGILYPIFDIEWVSPIQVVPKKISITVIRNDKNELVPLESSPGGASILTIEN